MQVAIGGIVGLCGRCGCEDFDAPPPGAGGASKVAALTCKRCGAETAYGDLVVQISQEAVNQGQHDLRVLKSWLEAYRARFKLKK